MRWLFLNPLCIVEAYDPQMIKPFSQKFDKGNVYSQQSFELFGFDVMFDEDMKPWLIEVCHHTCTKPSQPHP